MAKFSVEEFISAIKEMSVLELNELVKAIEEEFGVSAAAPVAVAGAAPAAAVARRAPGPVCGSVPLSGKIRQKPGRR